MTAPMRLAVIGHAQHILIARVATLPAPGDIVHLDGPRWFPGGGGVAFFQLTKSPGEIHFFTAIGSDDTGTAVLRRLEATSARIHPGRPAVPHSRDLVFVTPDAERTIIVLSEPLHPRHEDPLPWTTLAGCDAVLFTAQDPELIRKARAARVLVVTARRAEALRRAQVAADVVVGSAADPREASTLADYPLPPHALVMTEGGSGGWIETAAGRMRFPPSPPPPRIVCSYGAGDTFAAALTWYVAKGHDILDACTRAAVHGAAVLQDTDPTVTQLPLA